jgi:hypothetical protein
MVTGLLVPRHLRHPGEEGYRTPTIEDVESNSGAGFPFSLPLNHPEQPGSEAPRPRRPNGDRWNPIEPDGVGPKLSHHQFKSWPKQLSWKGRTRHLTWAFFTLTMATGGLANVIHSSKPDAI